MSAPVVVRIPNPGQTRRSAPTIHAIANRSIYPYADVKTAITCEEAESFPVSSFFYSVKMRLGSQVKRLARDGWRGQEAFAELIFSQ